MKLEYNIQDFYIESSGFEPLVELEVERVQVPFDYFVEKDDFESEVEIPVIVYFLVLGIFLFVSSVYMASACEKYQDRHIDHGEQYMREYSAWEIRESKTKIINSLDWDPPVIDSRIPIFQINSSLFTRDSMKKKQFPTASASHYSEDESEC